MLKHIPNILTIIRFLLIPFIIFYALQDNYIAVILVLTLSGRLIDPLADKCTQISVLVVLCIKNIIPRWIICVVIIKELLSVIGAIVLYEKQLVTSSKWFRKACNSYVLFGNNIIYDD